jgi:glutamyl endopeptidase
MSFSNLTTKVAKAAGAVFGLALLATTAASAAEKLISSSGKVEALRNSAARSAMSPSYEGTGPLAAPTADTASEYARLSSYRGISMGGRSVIGADGRIRVTATTSTPWRKIALITFNTPQGGSICTGWFVNQNTVITAGHCVHRGFGGQSGFYNYLSYRVYPARNGSSRPFPTCTARDLFTNTTWAFNGTANYDYGAVKLNCSVGLQTGWFGYWSQSSSLVGTSAIVAGYPGDKVFGTMWMMAGSIGRETARRVFYRMDTYGGQSGSPVFRNRAGCGWCSMAIHAYGASGSPLMNGGTRITPNVVNFINQVKGL